MLMLDARSRSSLFEVRKSDIAKTMWMSMPKFGLSTFTSLDAYPEPSAPAPGSPCEILFTGFLSHSKWCCVLPTLVPSP